MHGTVFRTRKIRTSAPLGSWVVRDRRFCGVVIASYEAEPYVHMTTSQDLMNDIIASSSQTQTINLPGQSAMVLEERLQDKSAKISPCLPSLPAGQKLSSNCDESQQGRIDPSTTCSEDPLKTRCFERDQNFEKDGADVAENDLRRTKSQHNLQQNDTDEAGEDHATRLIRGKTRNFADLREGGHDLVCYFMAKSDAEPRRHYQAEFLSTLIQADAATDLLAHHGELPSRAVAWIDDRTNDGDIDQYAVTALMLTAPRSQVEALSNAFFQHLAFKSHIGATVSSEIPSNFTFLAQLPFYTCTSAKEAPRDLRTTRDGSSLRKVLDLRFLEGPSEQSQHDPVDYLCEAQISILLTGLDDQRWTSYCFVDTYYEPEGMRERVDRYRGDAIVLDGLQNDRLTAGLCDTNGPMLDPGVYFLAALAKQAKEFKNEWLYTTHLFRRKIKEYMS
ncbi:hypothetical protein FSARC_12979 [Fusarium sarcochroum]|uniref:Uncharacterized protein n=1 Tax=Fusarium sarcochroum TaxID=1208366 RepID=A0A8H4T4S0_9HYPO|nr:hypothetical protein FSARC_12979 [Fusarium sarcochroum]